MSRAGPTILHVRERLNCVRLTPHISDAPMPGTQNKVIHNARALRAFVMRGRKDLNEPRRPQWARVGRSRPRQRKKAAIPSNAVYERSAPSRQKKKRNVAEMDCGP